VVVIIGGSFRITLLSRVCSLSFEAARIWSPVFRWLSVAIASEADVGRSVALAKRATVDVELRIRAAMEDESSFLLLLEPGRRYLGIRALI
jgi:hypothetical protein